MPLRRRVLATLVLSIWFAAPWGTGALAAPQQDAATIALDQPVPVDGRITIGRLPNGLRYYIRTNGRPSSRAELRLVVDVGSVAEDADQLGLAHVVEHLAFNGSRHFAQQDLIRFMESIGMRLGPGVNANTGLDETVYMLHVPTDNREAMGKAFLFLADVAGGLSFDPAAIEKERGVIIEEWRQGLGAEARIRDQQLPVLLKGSRYAERLPIGTRASIETFKPEALRRFYTDWYRPDLMAVIAVGDFNKAEIEALIKEHFAGIPARLEPRPRPAYDVPDHAEPLFSVTADPEMPATSVTVYNKLPVRDQTTVGSYRQLQVERLYTRMLNARLAELTLKADPPFVQAATDRGLFVRSKEAAMLAALVKEDGIEHGLEALVAESARAARHGFTAAELERERRETLRLYEGAFAERDKEESADLAAEYIRNFTQQEPIPGITYEYGLVQRFVPGVSLDEVNKVARDWAGGSRVVLVSAPRKAGLAIPDGTRLAAVIKSATARELEARVEVTSDRPLLEREPEAGRIAGVMTRGAIGITEWELSNGARVVLKPTDFRQDEVMFRATSPGGTSLASDTDYVAALTAGQVIDAGGAGSFDAIQLRNALAGKAASVTAFIDDTDEGLGGGASPKDLETLFQLIYLAFTGPRADQTAFQAMTGQMKVLLGNQQASPEWTFRQTVRAALAQNHFRSRPLTPEMIGEMDLQRSFAFYKDRFADASDFTFVFAGNFDLAVMRPLVERYLASLPALHRKESWKDVGIVPPKGVVEKTVRKGIEPKGQAAVVFTGPLTFDAANRVALEALAVVLETRLRETLRDALSGTYGVEVGASASKIPAARYSVTIEFGCDPGRTEELVKTLFREIERLRTAGPTAEEVNDARQALLRQHESNLAQNNRLVAEISARVEAAEDIRSFFDLPAEYAKLTAAAVQDAARNRLDTGNYVKVILYPEKQGKEASAR